LFSAGVRTIGFLQPATALSAISRSSRAELADQIAEDDRHQASQMVAQAT